jgi:cytoskeletal protein RodZ
MDRQPPHDPARITIAPGETVDRAEFAEFLRKTREQRQITLDQISGETKIASRHLAALERGDVRTWPGGMYRRAMMRAYAESIGLDKDYALEQFDRAFEQPEPPAPPAPVVQQEQPAPVQAAAPPPEPEPQPRFERPAFTLPRIPMPNLTSPAVRRGALALVATAAVITLAILLWPSARGDSAKAPERVIASDTPRAVTQPPAATPAPPVVRASNVSPAHESAAPVATSGPSEQSVATDAKVPAATEGQIVITSDPAGARVTINGVGWGETPLTVRFLPLGTKRVRLTMQGYVSQERVVSIGPERPNARLSVELQAREASATERQ